MKINKKIKTNMLRLAISERFYPALKKLGFIQDETSSTMMSTFRKSVGSTMQVYSLLWGMGGCPRFKLQYTEISTKGVDFADQHFSSCKITAFSRGIPRAQLRPCPETDWFMLKNDGKRVSPSVMQIARNCNDIIQTLHSLIPKVAVWWDAGTNNMNYFIIPAEELPGKPKFTCVIGRQRKVSLCQQVFAREWIWTFFFFFTATCIGICILGTGYLTYPGDINYKIVLQLLFAGACTGLMIAIMLIKVLLFIRIRLNGGPLHEGDVVQVIAGAHAGRIGIVYEKWPSRGEIKVDLGEKAWKNVTDVFGEVQVIKTVRLKEE